MKFSKISCEQADKILNLDIQQDNYSLFFDLFTILGMDVESMSDAEFYGNIKKWVNMKMPKVKAKALSARQQVAFEKIINNDLNYCQLLAVIFPSADPKTTPVTFLLPYISQYMKHGIKLLG